MVFTEQMNALAFRLFSDDEIRRMSVLEIITPNSFDSIEHAVKGGLYDLTMGPSGMQSETCLTCKQTARHCPGHLGHIELPLPVINPLFQKEIVMLLRITCNACKKVNVQLRYKYLLMYQLKLLNAGYITEAEELADIISDVEGPQFDQAHDIAMKNKILEYVNLKNLSLDREVPFTKTSESLRKQFLDNYNKRVDFSKRCLNCKSKIKKIIKHRDKIIAPERTLDPSDPNGNAKGSPILLFPSKSKQILRGIWEEEREFIESILPILKYREGQVTHGTDLLFMNAILVPPPKMRPLIFVRGKATEHQQSRLFKEVIKNCIIVKEVKKAALNNSYEGLQEESRIYIQGIAGDNITQKLQHCWQELQSSVDALLSTHGKNFVQLLGLKQLIEKKEGTLRQHMMGKRVNYAARSVITPDPNLLIQEIGIPEQFAKKLTYPVKANYFNVHELRKMVKNGPDVYPGANIVEMENGSIIRLMPGEKNSSKRDGVAKLLLKSVASGGGKVVHRHLLNGDVLLLNRQPTLHRPSIMAHKARILKGEKTLRLHYSNCKSYNADFDGDEMNAHFPQSEIARSEAYNIVSVKENYLVPKDGTPLGGLIQDHIISGVRLTIRGKFFNKEDYYQLVYQGLSHCKGDIKLLPPTILKPQMLWSGKQIISTILINIIPKNKALISLHSRAKIRDDSWRVEPSRPWKCGKEFLNKNEMSESDVIIHNGQLLCGVLDKEHYGATPYGLTHCLYELYGGSCSMKFLDSAGKLFTAYLQFNGFTLGIKDILINENVDRERNKIIDKVRQIGETASKNALDLEDVPADLEEKLEAAYYEDKTKFKARLDQEYKKILNSYTNDINGVCIPGGLITRFPENNLQLMVTSGAKGSTVNTMQISCLLGQIELEGKRPPLMISGKSLPCFRAFETDPSAGGYVHARFMTGITPQDFFFHCMAGREGLIDTAVKTARSGYLQRCLIKHLEGVMVSYDGTVRDHDSSVVQFAYGEDGLEVQKSRFLNENQMDFLYRNKNSIVDESILQILKDSLDMKKIEKHKKRIKAWDNEWKGEKWRRSCHNGFALFSAHIRDQIREKYWHRYDKSTGRCKASQKIVKKWNKLDEKEKNAYKSIRPDPVTAKFNRNRDFGVITEKLEDLIEDYLNAKSRHNKSENVMRNIINIKYISSLSQPGEAVGLLAAQSIGEPSTQMTLNTFHFAGRGEMNVTLGIPRLREILMSATKAIKTPYMEIPIKKKNPDKMEKVGNKLKKKFQMVTLSDVLQTIVVKEKLVTRPTMLLTYNLKFTFLPFKSYKKCFNATPKEILRFMEKDFLISLSKHIRKLGKKYGDIIYESKEERLLTKNNDEEKEKEADNKSVYLEPKQRSDTPSSSEGELDDDDDDATAAKLRQRHQNEREYDDPNESDYEFSEDEGDDITAEVTAGDENGFAADEENEDTIQKVSVVQMLDAANREDCVLKTFPMVQSYKYDLLNEEWCEMVFGIPATLCHIDFYSLLKDICDNSVIYQVPNVKRAILSKNNKGGLSIKTEGINLIEIFKYHKLLDVNKLYTNDIHEMAKVYGIEAAARVIVNELKEVFGVYGITVDPRHLLLIADFMTHQGIFSPFSRMGITCNPSPLQQMSFESTIAFLKEALTWSKTDMLTSPSSRIMTGKYCKSGTGCFDLFNEGVYSMYNKVQSKEIRVCSGTGFQ